MPPISCPVPLDDRLQGLGMASASASALAESRQPSGSVSHSAFFRELFRAQRTKQNRTNSSDQSQQQIANSFHRFDQKIANLHRTPYPCLKIFQTSSRVLFRPCIAQIASGTCTFSCQHPISSFIYYIAIFIPDQIDSLCCCSRYVQYKLRGRTALTPLEPSLIFVY